LNLLEIEKKPKIVEGHICALFLLGSRSSRNLGANFIASLNFFEIDSNVKFNVYFHGYYAIRLMGCNEALPTSYGMPKISRGIVSL
jgi:hypothetical protein